VEQIFRKKFFTKKAFLIKKILKWAGCSFVILGALLTAFNIYPLNLLILNIGIIFYVIWSILVKEYSILVLNVVLFVIYLVGYVSN
tara:strand:+ start:265 stop:522 length:258 start_codon:yes stop_codon:yes gene_type:complete